MKKLIGPVLLLVILIGMLYLLFTYTHVRAPFSLPAQSSGVQITTAQVHDEGSSYTINVQYPQFGISAVDAQIQKAIDAAITEIKSYPANPPDSATPKNSLEGTFDSIYVGPDVVSVELILSQDTGGAHPITVLSGMNFDRTSGSELTLDDVQKMTGLTLQQIADGALTQLKAKLGGDLIFPEGAAPTADNYGTFLVGVDTLTFIFNDYQVAPYSSGPQKVTFPRVN